METLHFLMKWRESRPSKHRACLVTYFKQQFSHFTHTYTHFNILFHLHIFQKIPKNSKQQFSNCGITTDPFRQKVKFKFASKTEIDDALNLIHAKVKNLNFPQQEVKYKKIAEQISNKLLQ